MICKDGVMTRTDFTCPVHGMQCMLLVSQFQRPSSVKGGWHPKQKTKLNKDVYYDKHMNQTKKVEPNLLSVTEKFKYPCTNSITSILQSVHKTKEMDVAR